MYRIQELYDGHWLVHDVVNTSYTLDDFIDIVEGLYMYNKRKKYRVFDYSNGLVVYK